MGPSMLGVFVSIDSIRRMAHDLDMKFALILSTLDFDSALRGYLTTPLALRFLGSRRNAGKGVVEGARWVEGAPRRSLHLSRGERGGSQSCGRRLQDRRMHYGGRHAVSGLLRQPLRLRGGVLGAGASGAGLTGTGGSVEFALALGRPLIVEPRGAAFALRTLLSLGGTPFALIGGLCVFVRDCRMFRRAFTFMLGLVLLLRRGNGVGLGFLAMSGDLLANSLAFAFAFAAPGLDQSSGCEQHQRKHNDDGDNDDDYGSR